MAYSMVMKLNRKSDGKVGLVGPDLKEIIPVKYDIIRNVGGTVSGLVEVEKNKKRGLYNLGGKLVAPVIYDEIYPLDDDENLALLKANDDYFYLKNDTTVSDKLYGFKIADELPKIRGFGKSLALPAATSKSYMEYNEDTADPAYALVITPSYLTDLDLLPGIISVANPLSSRQGVVPIWGPTEVKYNGMQKPQSGGNWFTGIYYSLFSHYLAGRSMLYRTSEDRTVVIVDEKQNRLMGFSTLNFVGTDDMRKNLTCNENTLKAIDDTLVEYRTSERSNIPSAKDSDYLVQGPEYQYLHVSGGKLVALPHLRQFACTAYVKMDDTYFNGCFTFYKKGKYVQTDHLTPEVLEFMKNEIYASHGYNFHNQWWNAVFQYRFGRMTDADLVNSVEDKLTAIDKYNINWINGKLNALKSGPLASR